MPVRINLIGLIALFSAASFAQTPQPDAPKFTVSRYEVVGENPLSFKSTQSVLEPFIGEHEGLEGLQSAADALEQIIRSNGYSFHRVLLPPQTLQGGAVQLQVVEFRLGKIQIENNRYFTDSNVRNSMPGLNVKESPNLKRLARSLRLANNHPAKKITLGFKESETEQAVDAVLTVEDRSPHSVFTVLQNTGSEETGDHRLSLGYQYSNLFDRDHAVSLIYTTSPDETDAVSQAGISYRIPFYSVSGVLSFSYSDSDIESATIDTGPSDSGDQGGFFSITGKGTAAAVAYVYSLAGSGLYQHDLSFSYEDKAFDNDLFLEGDLVPPEPQCVELDGEVQSTPFGLVYKGVIRGTSHAIGFSVGVYENYSSGQFGDDAAYDCIRPNLAKSDWSATRYALNYDQRIAGEWLMSFRANGQSAGEPLIPGEQFGLGGANSVRGYEERSILGDDGWQANLEFWTPSFASNSMNALLFYDAGRVEGINAESIEPEVIEVAGAGIGLRWVWNKQLSLRADAASALEAHDTTEDGDTTYHFSVYYRF